MKNLFIKKLLFLLFISLHTIAQGASFSISFTLPKIKSANIVLLKQISINETTHVKSKSCIPSNLRNILRRTVEFNTLIATTAFENRTNVLNINGNQQWLEIDGISATDSKTLAVDKQKFQYFKGYLIFNNTGNSYVLNFKNLRLLDKSKPVSRRQTIIFVT